MKKKVLDLSIKAMLENTTAAPAATQPEALRCAEWLEHIAQGGEVVSIKELARTAAAELRRLHALTTAPAAQEAGPAAPQEWVSQRQAAALERNRKALQWTAAGLQAVANEEDVLRISEFGEEKTVRVMLDEADSALEEATSALAAEKPRCTAAPAPLNLSAFEKARFGVFNPDGRFEEIPEGVSPCAWAEAHPCGHTARWVGGPSDVELLRAALASAGHGRMQLMPAEPAARPPTPITALMLREDDAQAPAFCVMAAYRTRAEAATAFDLLGLDELLAEMPAAQEAGHGAPADFPPRILALLGEAACRHPAGPFGPWEDGNGEPLQDDADAALAWIAARTLASPGAAHTDARALAIAKAIHEMGQDEQDPDWEQLAPAMHDMYRDRAEKLLKAGGIAVPTLRSSAKGA